MKLYNFDMSGLSNPHVTMPEEIPLYAPIWDCVTQCIADEKIAVTAEIYKELTHITGKVECIKQNKAGMIMEVDDPSWDGGLFINHFNRMRKEYREWDCRVLI